MLNPSLKVEGEKRVKCICIQRNSVNMTRVYYENGCKLRKYDNDFIFACNLSCFISLYFDEL